MKVKLTHKNAKAPKRANPTDAGMDLFATEDMIVEAHNFRFMNFGFACEIPEGYCGLIFARSGLGSKDGVRPRNCVGVIDSKYRGDVGMMVENHSNAKFQIHTGDRIAQMVIVPIYTDEVVVVDELDMTDDRKGGFGSSGKK